MQGPPQFTQSLKDQTVTSGSSARLSCHLTGTPQGSCLRDSMLCCRKWCYEWGYLYNMNIELWLEILVILSMKTYGRKLVINEWQVDCTVLHHLIYFGRISWPRGGVAAWRRAAGGITLSSDRVWGRWPLYSGYFQGWPRRRWPLHMPSHQ